MPRIDIPEHLSDEALKKRKAEIEEGIAATKKRIDTLDEKMDYFKHDAGQYEGIMSMIREQYPRLRELQGELAHIVKLLSVSLAQREKENKQRRTE